MGYTHDDSVQQQNSCMCWVQIRNKVYDMLDTLDPYGIELGFAINAVSALRGQVSAAADSADNSADQGITINGVSQHLLSSCNALVMTAACLCFCL